MSKTILVTGTSTGLGIDIAVRAARAGHIVYATMRNLERRTALDTAAQDAGVELNVRRLDVQDTATITPVVDEIIAAHGRIDTLVNNAGLGFVRSTEQAREEDIEKILDINFTGVVRCTKAVMPHMRKARAGHVVNISSVGGLVGQPFNEIYCGAKFAVEGYTESLASYVTPAFGINFTAVEPGGIASEFANNVLAQVAETGGMLDDEYLPIVQKYIGAAQVRQGVGEDGGGVYQTTGEVAEVVMGVIEADMPPIRCRTSEWAEAFTRLKTGLDPDGRMQQARVIEEVLGGFDRTGD